MILVLKLEIYQSCKGNERYWYTTGRANNVTVFFPGARAQRSQHTFSVVCICPSSSVSGMSAPNPQYNRGTYGFLRS